MKTTTNERTRETVVVWNYTRIVGHRGPLSYISPGYKGSRWNVIIEWENGDTSEEPLSTLATDNPVTCAIYAEHNGLLDTHGWKQFRDISTNATTAQSSADREGGDLSEGGGSDELSENSEVSHDSDATVPIEKWEEYQLQLKADAEYQLLLERKAGEGETKPPPGRRLWGQESKSNEN